MNRGRHWIPAFGSMTRISANSTKKRALSLFFLTPKIEVAPLIHAAASIAFQVQCNILKPNSL